MIFDIDNWKEITATLSRNKTRTFLTAFGIFWGTLMLALLWGGAQGLQGLMRSNFDGFASNSAIIFSQRTTIPYKGYKKGLYWSLNTTDVENIRRIVPELSIVSPMWSRNSTIKYKDRTHTGSIQGLMPDFIDVLSPIVTKGRFINETDIANDSKVCVLGENAAATLLGDKDPVGEFVEVDNVFYKIVGVVKQRSEISFNGRLDDSMLLPLTTVQRTYNAGNTVHFLSLVARDGHTPGELRDKIYRAIRISHPLHPDDKGAMFFMDISENFEQIDNLFTGIDLLILFVGLSSLIAGIIGVGNIMWIIVKERTKEFGIRRALGAKPRSVMWQILAESAILTVIAGTAGICFSVLILGMVTPMVSQGTGISADFQLSFTGAVVIMVLFMVLGSAAGAIPAVKAMRIKPIEALNDK